MPQVDISVCIATFKRPHLLANLLQSIAVQEFRDSQLLYEIIVVDNDKNGSAKDIVAAFAERNNHLSVKYDIEPEQNISLARNKTVNLSVGDYIAFIDDDEQAAPDWLSRLHTCLLKYKANAVFGIVITKLPDNCPEWIKKGNFFDRPFIKDGGSVKNGRTGNTLVEKTLLFEDPPFFDPAFGLTGGEDFDFFQRIRSKGAKLCASEYALVYEYAEPQRLQIKWLLGRAFRGGQNYADKLLIEKNLFKKIFHFLFRSLLCSVSFFFCLLSLPFGRHHSVFWLMKVFSNAGQVSVFLPFRYKEYIKAGTHV